MFTVYRRLLINRFRLLVWVLRCLTREWPSIVARGRIIPLKFEQLRINSMSVAGVEEKNTAVSAPEEACSRNEPRHE